MKPFHDKPRNRMAYIQAYSPDGIYTRDMMMDEIVIENKWQVPIYFSSSPYAESPLKLRERSATVGMLYKLLRDPEQGSMDIDRTYELYMNTYQFTGLESPEIYRDDNATGLFTLLGNRVIQLHTSLLEQGKSDSAVAVLEKMIDVYPEFWQVYFLLATQYESEGDSARALEILRRGNDTLEVYVQWDDKNAMYLQNLGMLKYEIGQRTGDNVMLEAAVDLLWRGFKVNVNELMAFRNLVAVLAQLGRYTEMQRAALMIAPYKRNMSDPVLQHILKSFGSEPAPPGS